VVVAAIMAPLAAVAAMILRLGHHGGGCGRQGERDDGGLGQAVHLATPFKKRNPCLASTFTLVE
jgi:hypothetical protein